MLTASDCRTYHEFSGKYQWYVYPVLAARLGRLVGGVVDVAVDMGPDPEP